MPRKARIDAPGALHHIIVRGIERRKIFKDDTDRNNFLDHHRVILEDLEHSDDEKRYYCLGRVAGGIVTVRFIYRRNKIRIIGAGYWRKGKKIYERENKIHG